MLVVGRVEVGEVDFGETARERVGVVPENADLAFEPAPHRERQVDGPENARERVPVVAPELAPPRAAVLVKALEHAGRVRVHRRLGDERGQEERALRFGQATDQAAGRVEVARIARRVERPLARGDAPVVGGSVQVGDEPGLQGTGVEPGLQGAVRFLEPRHVELGFIGEVAAIPDFRVPFQVIDRERTRGALQKPGDHPRAGKEVGAVELRFPQAPGRPLHAAADEIEQGALVPDAGDELPGEEVFFFRHGAGGRRVLTLSAVHRKVRGECSGGIYGLSSAVRSRDMGDAIDAQAGLSGLPSVDGDGAGSVPIGRAALGVRPLAIPRYRVAFTSPTWLKACGKLPSCLPVR